MTANISKIENKNGFVVVTVVMTSESGFDVRELHLPFDEWDKGRYTPPCPISKEELEDLFVKEECYLAYEAGVRILAYGDNSSADLRRKLRLKKYSAYAAEKAVELLKAKGYIDDFTLLNDKVIYYANEKLHGRRRIIAELTAKGFTRREVERALERCEGAIDFSRNRARLIEQRFGRSKERSAEEIVKIKAFLYRNGY
ncbi:MAG: regulatory protein RecX [Clostridia bacterium]|nr:regulatory protein RecX [Clostridia bacterium]